MRASLPSSLAFATVLFSLAVNALPATHVEVEARAAAAKSTPTAKTLNGTYVGKSLPAYNQDLFLGIPFAQPPVGDLRFRNALSLNTSFTGKRAATEFASECVGYGSDQWGYPVSEDCLYLNVVRPTGTKASSNLPVGVWIHVSNIIAVYPTSVL